MTGRPWVHAVVAAGATAAGFVPDQSARRADRLDVSGAELIEDPELRVHPVGPAAWHPRRAAFLDGIHQWQVVAYDGIAPVVRGWVAAAVRRRGDDRRLRTAHERGYEVCLTFPDRLSGAVRAALDAAGVPLLAIPDEQWGPANALAGARIALEAERVRAERTVGELWAAAAPADEWLIVDGVLSDHAVLTAQDRALGVVKSHGAQYFTGAPLELAVTLPAGHRTSVFRPAARGSGAVFSWYLRLWPWEGNDLLYGLVRVEAPARPAMVRRADALSAWLLSERVPLASPDPRWDRLLYPLHDVETYLRTRAPHDLRAPTSRLPARPA
jgi:hypothetical protein